MYVYGKNVATEMFLNNKKIEEAFLIQNFSDKDILEELKNKNIKITYLRKDQIDRMIDGNHQGIVLKVEDYKYAELDKLNVDDSIVVILDHLEDPHNFGAIIRTCEAASVNGIIIPKDRSVSVNSTVAKVSTGTLEHMNIVQVTNLNNTIKELKDEGFWIIGTDMEGTDYRTIDYSGKIAIVVGNEGKGMSRLISESCDFIATIPMRGKVNSLNASVATGIVVFEALKCKK